MLAPNIVIDITFYWFEGGQKLIRSRSNYFAHDGQRAIIKEKNWLFQGTIEFYFTNEYQKQYFNSRLRHSWKYCCWRSFTETKFDFTLKTKHANILYILGRKDILISTLVIEI